MPPVVTLTDVPHVVLLEDSCTHPVDVSVVALSLHVLEPGMVTEVPPLNAAAPACSQRVSVLLYEKR